MSTAIPVRPKDWVCFHCTCCADCCRGLEGDLMLEPPDAYDLARVLRAQDRASSIHDIYERYATVDLLEGRLPIYLMNTVGNDHACVLLKDGRCSAYEGRPSVCRIYPLSVRPGQRGKPFEYYRCVDQHAAHFSDGKMQVKDWLHENFSRESREFWTAEGSVLPTLGCLLNKLDTGELHASLFQILYYRYYNYDFDLLFMPQYQKNMAALVHFLQQRLGEV